MAMVESESDVVLALAVFLGVAETGSRPVLLVCLLMAVSCVDLGRRVHTPAMRDENRPECAQPGIGKTSLTKSEIATSDVCKRRERRNKRAVSSAVLRSVRRQNEERQRPPSDQWQALRLVMVLSAIVACEVEPAASVMTAGSVSFRTAWIRPIRMSRSRDASRINETCCVNVSLFSACVRCYI